MGRKQYIKRHAQTAFSRATGYATIQLSGTHPTTGDAIDCIVTHVKTVETAPIERVAFLVEHGFKVTDRPGRSLVVTRTCGVDQCVNPKHLVGEFKPTEEQQEELKNTWWIESEVFAENWKVPAHLIEPFRAKAEHQQVYDATQ